jgi:hypothetical protein
MLSEDTQLDIHVDERNHEKSFWSFFFPWTETEASTGTELNDPEFTLLKKKVIDLDLQLSLLKKREMEIGTLYNNAVKKTKEKECIYASYEQNEIKHLQLVQSKLINFEGRICELVGSIKNIEFDTKECSEQLMTTTKDVLETVYALQKADENETEYNLVDYSSTDRSRFLEENRKIQQNQKNAMLEITNAKEEEIPVNLELKKIRQVIADLTEKKNVIVEFINKMTVLMSKIEK